ncbi:Retrovirus-related Pol polyprotein from transposon [Smittium culicis]|uniref:Retrovirus-related Pol polyprotein from transposon n=1 Tax=Smittium culicis TaxID=133412 RepID=A0A1R1YQW7_9FUNG|nr:Retrovirus-related Pol polyprotein from transposon [Smittium culicis]
MSKFQLLPSKFKGDGTDTMDADVWVAKLKSACTIGGIEATKEVDVFKLWLEGKAANWQFDEGKKESTREWNLEEWTKELCVRFSKHKNPAKKDIFTLSNMRKNELESMFSFNLRFKEYLALIPETMYTMDWNNSSDALEKLMEESSRLMELKEILNAKKLENVGEKASGTEADLKILEKPTEVNVKNSSVTEQNEPSYKEQIEKITENLRALTLLVSGGKEKKDYSNVTCYNCRGKGHTAAICKMPRNSSTASGTFAKQSKDNAMLAVEYSEETDFEALSAIASTTAGNKRMRVDYLTEMGVESSVNSLPVATLAPTTRKGKPVKVVTRKREASKGNTKTKKKLPSDSAELTKKILNSPAPLSIMETLVLKPKILDEVINYLKLLKRKKNNVLLADKKLNNAREKPVEALSYILTHVKGEPLPLFLDPGARYSIIKETMAEELQFPIEKLEVPINIRTVSGDLVQIFDCTRLPLEFEKDLIIPTTFIVMRDCAVPILLGLDVCQNLKAAINYEEETFELTYRNKRSKFQLLSKDNIYKVAEITDSEYSDSSSEEEYEDTEHKNNSEDESVPLFYSGVEAAISGAGNPETEDLQPKDNFTRVKEATYINDEQNRIEELLEEYVVLFAESYDQLPGIKNSEYSLNIPENLPIQSCKLRRYSPAEKEIINSEITVILKNKIIQESDSEWLSPIQMVPKSNGEYRFCFDYRRINKLTGKDKFPSPE